MKDLYNRGGRGIDIDVTDVIKSENVFLPEILKLFFLNLRLLHSPCCRYDHAIFGF